MAALIQSFNFPLFLACCILCSALTEHSWSSQGVGEMFIEWKLSIKRPSRDKSIKNGFEIIRQQNVLMLLHKDFEYCWGTLQNWSYHPGPWLRLVNFCIDVNCRGIREFLVRVPLLALCLWGLVLTIQDLDLLLHCYIYALLSKNVDPLHLKGMCTRNCLTEENKGKMAWDIPLLNTEAFFLLLVSAGLNYCKQWISSEIY